MAAAPPPGINLNDNRGPEVNRAITVIAVLATVALTGRLTARRLKRVALGPSDYTIILGWITAWGTTILVYIGKRALSPRS